MTLVMVPLKKELQFLLTGLKEVKKNSFGFAYRDFQFCVGGMGKLNFALNTFKLVTELKPKEVWALGTCGGLNKDLKPLDLVEVDRVVEHDFESSFAKAPCYQNTASSRELRKVLCASGDKDILTAKDKSDLIEKTGADVVNWESAAFFKTMSYFDLPHFEYRVVSDLADELGGQDFLTNLEEGMLKLQKALMLS